MSLSKTKCKASNVSSGGSVNVDNPEKDIPPSVQNTIGDVPPEVLTMILEFATLNNKQKNILSLREVNSQWRDIMNPLIEKRIVAAEFPVSPRMKIFSVGRKYTQLHVRFSPEGFAPLLFNSLLLSGDKKVADIYDDPELSHISLTLPIFISRFGGSLTSFGLHDQIIPLKSVLTMLSSMPNLKLINLKDTRLTHYDILRAVLPTPPPLPRLSTLELRSNPVTVFDFSNQRNILYVWLIVSYSEQLAHLILQSGYDFPALQKAHQYSHRFENDKLCRIAISSDSSFDNLKQLQIFNPNAEFQELSETPGLKHISVVRRGGCLSHHFEELVRFISKYGSTLQSVCVDRIRDGPSCHPPYFTLGQRLQTVLGGVELSKLTTLSFPYPTSNAYERFLSDEFIPLFPSLKVLHLLHFEPHELEEFPEDMEANFADENDDADANTLKARLPPIWQLMNDLDPKIHAAYAEQRALSELQHQLDLVNELASQRVSNQIAELNRAMTAARNERASIFKRLVGLGENMETVIVEQLLLRSRCWDVCGNLQAISVSSGGKPDGDICLFRKKEFA